MAQLSDFLSLLGTQQLPGQKTCQVVPLLNFWALLIWGLIRCVSDKSCTYGALLKLQTALIRWLWLILLMKLSHCPLLVQGLIFLC